MAEKTCKSLEHLLPPTPPSVSRTRLPMQLDARRRELHREMAMHWPFHTDRSHAAPTIRKSKTRMSIRDGTKSAATPADRDSLNALVSHSPSVNLAAGNTGGSHGKQAAGEFGMDEADEFQMWSFKAQEGVIAYPLPDALPDGMALHNKLQKLMKTNTIYLNDRRFWTIIENRFKILRKQNFHESMQHLRESQQAYERELIGKGVMPMTTEQSIAKYVEQQREQMNIRRSDADNSQRRKCTIDYRRSSKPLDELDAFETDNVHPRFHEILPEYQFQTDFGKGVDAQFAGDLHGAQMRVKTIFPSTSQRDRVQQDLHAVKTSEGLYAYSTRMAKQISQ